MSELFHEEQKIQGQFPSLISDLEYASDTANGIYYHEDPEIRANFEAWRTGLVQTVSVADYKTAKFKGHPVEIRSQQYYIREDSGGSRLVDNSDKPEEVVNRGIYEGLIVFDTDTLTEGTSTEELIKSVKLDVCYVIVAGDDKWWREILVPHRTLMEPVKTEGFLDQEKTDQILNDVEGPKIDSFPTQIGQVKRYAYQIPLNMAITLLKNEMFKDDESRAFGGISQMLYRDVNDDQKRELIFSIENPALDEKETRSFDRLELNYLFTRMFNDIGLTVPEGKSTLELSGFSYDTGKLEDRLITVWLHEFEES